MSLISSFNEIGMIIGIVSIVLVIISELLNSDYGEVNVKVNKMVIRKTAIILSTVFLITVGIRLYILFVS